jgi:enoyl-CoA hydratase/carnithine racemase
LSLVETSIEGPVVYLTLNRPELRNALSVDLCNDIIGGLVAVDVEVARVLVIRGAGSVFCSGADFAAVSGAGGLEFVPVFERMLEAVARFRLPTIAAIRGAALGGGLQLATVCDFRVAADDARLGIPSSRLGIVVNFENVRRLVLLVGIPRAKEILMTGRTWHGTDAVNFGLVNEVVERLQLDHRVEELATTIAGLAPLSVQGSKKEIQLVADHLGPDREQNPDEVAAMDALVTNAYNSADLAEGIRAMTEKRDPRFTGH